MKRNLKTISLSVLTVMVVILFTNCEREQIVGDMEFVGSENCMTCHSEKYNDWIGSGHPYKFGFISSDLLCKLS